MQRAFNQPIIRRVFYSFHYTQDSHRVFQIRNIGRIERNKPATPNGWETIKKGGKSAIKKWIDGQMKDRSCTVVLVGLKTAGRPWINYEIKKSWSDHMGVVGIRIHGLKDLDCKTSSPGENPFTGIRIPLGDLRDGPVVSREVLRPGGQHQHGTLRLDRQEPRGCSGRSDSHPSNN